MRRLLLLLCTALSLQSSPAFCREWTDRSGEYHREAEFYCVKDGVVWLRSANDKYLVIAVADLCDADRAFVEKQASVPSVQPDVVASPQDQIAAAPSAEDRRSLGPLKATVPIHPAVQSRYIAAKQPGGPLDFRYVYFGCRGTYHLTATVGTSHFFSHCKSTLVALKYDRMTYSHIYYTVAEHGFEEQQWAFNLVPHNGCYYGVWRYADYDRNGTLEWKWVDSAHRVVPSLPTN